MRHSTSQWNVSLWPLGLTKFHAGKRNSNQKGDYSKSPQQAAVLDGKTTKGVPRPLPFSHVVPISYALVNHVHYYIDVTGLSRLCGLQGLGIWRRARKPCVLVPALWSIYTKAQAVHVAFLRNHTVEMSSSSCAEISHQSALPDGLLDHCCYQCVSLSINCIAYWVLDNQHSGKTNSSLSEECLTTWF